MSSVKAAMRATYLAFIATGFVFANWASRIPQVRDRLELDPSELGLLLLAIAVGSLVALPLSGPLVTHFGSRRTVMVTSVISSVGVAVAAIGYQLGVVPVAVGLLFFGFAQGTWDVAMNVQGTVVERGLGRAIMPRFHAGFSVGTVGGALLGALMVAWHVPVTWHLLGVALLTAAVVPLGVRPFLPDSDEAPDPEVSAGARTRRALSAWREPRTLLIGCFVLAFTFAEGTGNDWTSVALIDGYHLPAAVGTLGFAAFLAAMTAGRWVGPILLDRYGRVPVVRTLGVISLVGVLIFVFGQVAPLAFVGSVLWGFGLSLGFPVGMSAGADDPSMAPTRVSVVSSIGYCAFLAGPPVIGFLGNQVTVLRALTVVGVLLAAAILLSTSVRPLTPVRTTD